MTLVCPTNTIGFWFLTLDWLTIDSRFRTLAWLRPWLCFALVALCLLLNSFFLPVFVWIWFLGSLTSPPKLNKTIKPWLVGFLNSVCPPTVMSKLNEFSSELNSWTGPWIWTQNEPETQNYVLQAEGGPLKEHLPLSSCCSPALLLWSLALSAR